MITGVVNVDVEEIVRVPIRGADDRERIIQAVLDTGFNGSLTLPQDVIAALGLAWRTRGLVMLANGTEDQCDIYAATIVWDGKPRSILVESANTDPLIGMNLLRGYALSINVVDGGRVVIESLK